MQRLRIISRVMLSSPILNWCSERSDCTPRSLISVQEIPSHLARVMLSLGWELEELTERGTFELMYKSPEEMPMDRIASELFGRVRGDRIKRVVIDALGDLEQSSIDGRR